MARPEKVAQVDVVSSMLDGSTSVILSDFTGLDVEKVSDLRNKCREAGVEFKVVKNTLAKLGVKGTDAEGLSEYFEGATAIAVSREAENVPAKVLAEFAKTHEAPTFKGGFVDGIVIDATAVLALSKLPSKNELVSQLLGVIVGPGNGLVACLQGPLRNLLSVLDQIKDKQES
jgi:large subunit ribosomal protein L10